jgi:hypothetical protein
MTALLGYDLSSASLSSHSSSTIPPILSFALRPPTPVSLLFRFVPFPPFRRAGFFFYNSRVCGLLQQRTKELSPALLSLIVRLFFLISTHSFSNCLSYRLRSRWLDIIFLYSLFFFFFWLALFVFSRCCATLALSYIHIQFIQNGFIAAIVSPRRMRDTGAGILRLWHTCAPSSRGRCLGRGQELRLLRSNCTSWSHTASHLTPDQGLGSRNANEFDRVPLTG